MINVCAILFKYINKKTESGNSFQTGEVFDYWSLQPKSKLIDEGYEICHELYKKYFLAKKEDTFLDKILMSKYIKMDSLGTEFKLFLMENDYDTDAFLQDILYGEEEGNVKQFMQDIEERLEIYWKADADIVEQATGTYFEILFVFCGIVYMNEC